MNEKSEVLINTFMSMLPTKALQENYTLLMFLEFVNKNDTNLVRTFLKTKSVNVYLSPYNLKSILNANPNISSEMKNILQCEIKQKERAEQQHKIQEHKQRVREIKAKVLHNVNNMVWDLNGCSDQGDVVNKALLEYVRYYDILSVQAMFKSHIARPFIAAGNVRTALKSKCEDPLIKRYLNFRLRELNRA